LADHRVRRNKLKETMHLNVQRRTLIRARELCGSTAQLSVALKVPSSDLNLWLNGSESVPPWVFLRAVDLVNECEEGMARQLAGRAGDSASASKAA
jgi:hypothetical protein